MSQASILLTPSEAAVVANVPVRDIHRVIDEHILPDTMYELEGGRWLKSSACAFVSFYFHSAKALTADERSKVIRVLAASTPRASKTRWTVAGDYLTVNLNRFAAETNARHAKLMEARQLVVEDPDILGGAPVLKGTRIPVHDVAAAVAAGQSTERLKAAYPELDDERIALAALYAKANPQRGRPRTRSDLELISERKVARRSRG